MYKNTDIGVDIGSYYAKSSEEIKFENRISIDDSVLSGGAMKVEFKEKRYLIENGVFDINVNKTLKSTLLISIATLIGLSCSDVCINLGIGLPINFYKTQKKYLEDLIRENQEMVVSINGDKKRFVINKCVVVPEAVGVYYSLDRNFLKAINKKEVLIIDIGGKTTDTCIIDSNMTIKNPSTQTFGMLNLYNNIANLINSHYPELCIRVEDIRDILDNGLNSFDNPIDLGFIEVLYDKMVREIFNFIKLQYEDYQRKIVILCGGGFVLADRFKNYIPNIIVNKDIFANAKGFKRYVGLVGDK